MSDFSFIGQAVVPKLTWLVAPLTYLAITNGSPLGLQSYTLHSCGRYFCSNLMASLIGFHSSRRSHGSQFGNH